MLAFFGKLFTSIAVGVSSLFGVHSSVPTMAPIVSTSTQQTLTTAESKFETPPQVTTPAAKVVPAKTTTTPAGAQVPTAVVPMQGTSQPQATVTPPVQVTPVEQVAPTVKVSATPSAVEYGGESVIGWIATNALSCTLGPSPVLLAVSGSESVTPTDPSKNWSIANKTNYTVTCTGPGGSGSGSVAVTVQAWLPPSGYVVSPQCGINPRHFCTTGPNGFSCSDSGCGG